MKEELVDLITKIVSEKIKENPSIIKKEDLYVPVGVSARHLHVTREDLNILFGENYELTIKKELMGGQYAAEEWVTILGPKLNSIEKVRILGPIRNVTQVEISKTDGIKLGIKAPLRESGNLLGSAPITIVGPKGTVSLKEGCIVAKRHIHMSEEDSIRMGLKDNSFVNVNILGERGGILSNVQVRVHKTYTLEMHIDTDESNGLGIACGSKLEIIK